MHEPRGNPDCEACGGHLTVYGTVNTGPSFPSDGELCEDCVEWIRLRDEAAQSQSGND
jgi:hypothetical protein